MAQNIAVEKSNLTVVMQFVNWRKPDNSFYYELAEGEKSKVPKPVDVYRDVLITFSKEINKPILECDDKDVIKFLNSHCKKGSTFNSWLTMLRRFYAWYYNRDKDIPRKKWKPPTWFDRIEWRKTESDKYSVADMWTEEEILLAISTLDHPRDKAMIAMLYDTAARPHELMRLRIKDIAIKENYAQVKLVDHSNPEGRTVPITSSFQYLITWLNTHPLKNNPEASLWVTLRGVPSKVGYKGLYLMCTRKLKKLLGHRIHKPFNPYCMGDHSRLTNLVERGLSEFELKHFRGWKMDSKMPKRYIHMSGKGLNDKMLELAGIKQPELKEKESPLKPKECYRCKHKNAPDSKYCVQCNFVLSAEAFEEIKQREEEREDKIETLIERMTVVESLINAKAKDLRVSGDPEHLQVSFDVTSEEDKNRALDALVEVSKKHNIRFEPDKEFTDFVIRLSQGEVSKEELLKSKYVKITDKEED